jgi:preprotein translocase subunit Sec63
MALTRVQRVVINSTLNILKRNFDLNYNNISPLIKTTTTFSYCYQHHQNQHQQRSLHFYNNNNNPTVLLLRDLLIFRLWERSIHSSPGLWMSQRKNYYSVLGVGKSATNKDIKQAYYVLAKKFHPDTSKGDLECRKKFLEVSEAYEVSVFILYSLLSNKS